MTTTVADVVADGLARAGTERVFAVAGDGDAEPLIDAVGRRGLPVVPVARPDVACVMAAVSGGLTGVPGAAVIGRGLGAAAAGLAYASVGRMPALVIGAGGPIITFGAEATTKATLTVTAASAAHWVAHACRLAMTEPWGPVQLHVPSAVAATAAPPLATNCRPAPLAPPDPRALDAAVRLLEIAERPVVVVGRWCRSESDAAWTRAFAEARPAPVLATPKARGAVPDPHPLLIGLLDAGEPERALLASADLVVTIGVDPLEAPANAWPRGKTILELTPVAPEAASPDRVTVAGEVGLILEELAPRLREGRSAEWDVARLHALKQAAAAPPADASQLAAYRVVETARRLTPAGTIAVFEDHGPWPAAARAWQAVAPGELLIAAEGFAVAAASAAQLARPGRRVVCFAHSMRPARDQLDMVAALGLPVLTVILGGVAEPPADIRSLSVASIAGFADVFEAALRAGPPALLIVGGLRENGLDKRMALGLPNNS